MKRTIMLKKKYEFKNLFSKGNFYSCEYVNMYIQKTNNNYNKLGIAISKKQGKAVVRNHFKRLIKENYKNLEINLKLGYNILFIINKEKILETKKISYYDINKDMKILFNKARMFYEKNIN